MMLVWLLWGIVKQFIISVTFTGFYETCHFKLPLEVCLYHLERRVNKDDLMQCGVLEMVGGSDGSVNPSM